MNNMRTRKIIIYPLIMAFLIPITASATEVVGTEAMEIVGEENQEGHNEPDNMGSAHSESGNVSQPDAGIEEPENESLAENAPPEAFPEGEVITVPAEETMMESMSAETESESQTETETQTEIETETELEKPILDEEVTGLLKEYLTGAVSGNDAPQETSMEPENTEYQDYVKEALQVLQDNSTTQVNLLIVIMASVALTAGLLIGFLIMRRFL